MRSAIAVIMAILGRDPGAQWRRGALGVGAGPAGRDDPDAATPITRVDRSVSALSQPARTRSVDHWGVVLLGPQRGRRRRDHVLRTATRRHQLTCGC